MIQVISQIRKVLFTCN